MLMKDLLEMDAGSGSLKSLSQMIFALAESNVADNAGDNGGHGYDRNAIMTEVDKLFVTIKAEIHHFMKQ